MKVLAKILLGALWVVMLAPASMFGQEATEPVKPKIDLSYFYSGSGSAPVLVASVKRKTETRYEAVAGVEVEFYFNGDEEDNRMASQVTNEKGLAKIEIPPSHMKRWDSLAEYEFTAKVSKTAFTRSGSRSISIKKARLTLVTTEGENARQVIAKVEEWKEGWTPMKDVEVKFYIKRYFGMLPAGDSPQSSNDEGLAQVEFSSNIPGDSGGNIELQGVVDDHEIYGNLADSKTAAWGSPLTANEDLLSMRTLWSRREMVPLWLLIFPNLILLGVWSTIIYLLVIIVRIKKARIET